jgi:hypothetical protein
LFSKNKVAVLPGAPVKATKPVVKREALRGELLLG